MNSRTRVGNPYTVNYNSQPGQHLPLYSRYSVASVRTDYVISAFELDQVLPVAFDVVIQAQKVYKYTHSGGCTLAPVVVSSVPTSLTVVQKSGQKS